MRCVLPERVSLTKDCCVEGVDGDREARARVAERAEAATAAALCQEEALEGASWRAEVALGAGRGSIRMLSLKEERKRLGESSMSMSENRGRVTGKCRVERESVCRVR